MVDITKCHGIGCDKRDNCYRYTSKPGLYQAYGNCDGQKKPCVHYMPLTSGKAKK